MPAGIDILVGRALQNLAGGVSQQPPHIRLSNQAEEQINCVSRIVDGVSRRPPAEYMAQLLAGAVPAGGWKVHIYDRDGDERYVVLIGDNVVRVFDFDGTQATVTDTSSGYLNFNPVLYNSRDIFRAVTVADTTWITNTKVTPAMSGVATTARPVEFMFVAVSNTNATGSMYINSTKITWAITGTPGADMGAFITAFNAGAPGTWTLTQVGNDTANAASTVYAVQTAGTPATKITYGDDRSNSQFDLFFRRAQRFSDLPSLGYPDFTLEIVGADGDEADNYWVKYDESENTWVETVKPGIDNTFNEDTMPHVLVRTGVGTFDFKPYTWDTREKGDEISAPEPNFIGYPIRDLAYHKDRLILLAGESVSASEAGFYENFWPTTVTTVVDSDPFSTTGSSNRVANLDFAVPFHQNLSLFSSRGRIQQQLIGVDGVLTPRDANIVTLTEYETSPHLNPVVAGSYLYFVQDRDTDSGVYEWDLKGEHAFATEITSHIPRYIPGLLRLVTASTNEQMICFVPEAESSTLYVYSYHFADQEQKVQSSWSHWHLSEATNILGMDFIGSSLYLVCYRANGPAIFLMKLNMRKVQDGDIGYRVHLDHLQELTGSYSAATDLTTWTLPFGVDSDETWFAILANGQWETQLGRSIPLTVNPGSTTVTASGNWSAHPAHLGCSYESIYTFSPAVVEQEKNIANSAISKLMLRVWHIAYQQTGYFKVRLTRRDEDLLDEEDRSDPNEDEFTGREVGAFILGYPRLREGTFSFTANGDARHVRVTVTSASSYLPLTLTSAEWEGYYQQRSRQI